MFSQWISPILARFACCMLLTVMVIEPSTLTRASDRGSTDSQPARQKQKPQKTAWIQLFNGKDLTGWTPKFKSRPLGENYRNTFRVRNRKLAVCYDQWDRFEGEFGHLFYKTPFSHYRLRVEYRFVGEQLDGGPDWAFRNNGLMLHGQSAESMKLDQEFPNSIEVQLLGGDGEKERGNLNIATPGCDVLIEGQRVKRHVIPCGGPTFHGDQWVSIEVEVHGDRWIKHIVNGKTVVQYSRPQLDDGTPMTRGTISIQSESHPTEFRKIELLPLDP